MKAILLSNAPPKYVELADTNDSPERLDQMRDLIGCQWLGSGGYLKPGVALWIDDEGIFTREAGDPVFRFNHQPDFIFRNVLITGISDEGETTDVPITLEEATAYITFQGYVAPEMTR